MQIDIQFATWKRLTALLRDEDDSYDAVLTRLLRADGHPQEEDRADPRSGAVFKGVHLPEGTSLRATYRGKTYFATIKGDEWIDDASGERRSSPSQAASSITGSGVNGWLFWLVRRPGDGDWTSLAALRDQVRGE